MTGRVNVFYVRVNVELTASRCFNTLSVTGSAICLLNIEITLALCVCCVPRERCIFLFFFIELKKSIFWNLRRLFYGPLLLTHHQRQSAALVLWSRKRAVMLWNVCLCVFLHLCVYPCTSNCGRICVSCVSDRDLSLLSPFPHLFLSSCWITPNRVILGSPAIAHGSQRFLSQYNHETHRGRKIVSLNSVHHHEVTK